MKKKVVRTKRSDDELLSASDHLNYEFWMLGVSLQKLDVVRDQQDVNCALESFGIHARALADFLFNPSGRKDDMLAIDYLDDVDEWEDFLLQKKEIHNYLRNRVGKEIAHLSYVRLDVKPEEKRWDCAKIHKEIDEIFLEFLKRVPDERLEQKLIIIKHDIG